MKKFTPIIVLLLLMSLVIPTFAQDMPGEVLVDGLMAPRNIFYDADGNLFIAEAGTGGDLLADDGEPYGSTGQISVLSVDGNHQVVIKGLTSYRQSDVLGAHAVQVHGNSMWILLGETRDFEILFSHALLEVDLTTKRVKTYVDMLALELDQDPDGNANSQSNATDFVVTEDAILLANAGCNCIMSWSRQDGLQVEMVWDFTTDNPVPTSIEVGPDGDIYVGFLTGFPFPEGGSRIERWSDGELAQTYEGLTAVSGLLVTDDGTIYASEYGVFNQGWQPGRVVRVTDAGIEPVAEGLMQPFGLAMSPDGQLAVAVGSSGGEGGAVLAIPLE